MKLHIPQPAQPQKIKGADEFVMQIPQCCREGWEDCPHVAKPQKIKRRNIGL